MQEEITLMELVAILKKRMGLIINATLLGLMAFAIYTFFIVTPQYSASTQLLVNRSQQQEIIERSDIDTNVQLINTYSDIITNRVILDEVRETLAIDEALSERIEVTSGNNSQVFSIRVTDTNPYDAATIANTVATVFQENLDEIMNVDNVTIISQAEANMTPVSPNNAVNLLIGLALGGVIGAAIAFVIEYVDNTVKDEKFIIDQLGWTNLGRVSEMSPEELKSEENREISSHQPASRSARRV